MITVARFSWHQTYYIAIRTIIDTRLGLLLSEGYIKHTSIITLTGIMLALLFTAGYFVTQASKELNGARRRRKERKLKLKKSKEKSKLVRNTTSIPASINSETSSIKSKESLYSKPIS